MMRSNLAIQYLLLSSLNGVVPFIITLLVSNSGLWALLSWLVATLGTYLLISLVCMRKAITVMESELETHNFKGELEEATAAYR
jgi:hypothetical protein